MSEIETDYLWLSERPRPRNRLRRLILLLLCLSLTAGAAWLYTGMPQYTAPDHKPAVATSTLSTQAISADPRAQNNAATVATQKTTAPATMPDLGTPAANTALRTTLRIEPSKLLTPTDNLVYDRGDAATTPSQPPTRDGWLRLKIHKGDTLSTAFARQNLAYSDSLALAHLPEYGKYFIRHLRAGDILKVKANAQGHILALKYPLNATRTLSVQATTNGFDARITQTNLNQHIAYVTGIIRDSFYSDALAAGLSTHQIMQLVDIFKWTINFGYDIHPGDRFTVVYSELYKNGDKVANGHILAASFQTDSDRLRALRFSDGDGDAAYYRPDGSSLKRALLRSPVDYTRISSPFSMARNHPILHTVRAHEGIDYAAPMGTPIHAAGAGRIVSMGRNGGYGNMIAIDHGRGISTRYGHMSRFADGLSVGSHVDQGEIIGYVGSTGLSTGPHLHFEIRIDGVPKNPQTVELPGAPPLPNKYMDEFKAHIQPLIAQLKAVSRTTLASNSHYGARRHL